MSKKITKNKIQGIKAREIADSRKRPTLRVELVTGEGKFSASVPSGSSKGKYEAKEISAGIAVENINQVIAPRLKGKDASGQKEIDEILINLDGTKDKSRLGANAILGVSLAVCRAGASSKKMPLWKWISRISNIQPKLPFPSLLQVEGGLHAKNGPDVQEFMTVSQDKSFKENFNQGLKIYSALKKILVKEYGKSAIKLGLEGAFTPPIKDAGKILSLIMAAADKAGLRKKTKIILDIAATHDRISSVDQMRYLELIKQYPVLGIEDPFAENDWDTWRNFHLKIKNLKLKILLIGDDLTVTNPEKIKWAKKKNLCNALIIKPNQIGTVSETIGAAKLAKSFRWKIVVSHRSGETMDDFISDLAVGLGADFIKSGAPFPKERMVKYNRLIKIEKELNSSRS